MKLVLHPAAAEEARAARQWYRERSARVGTEFINCLRTAMQRIREAPERWPLSDNGSRRYVLEEFPYAIIYVAKTECVWVVAVVHQSRRPGYWHDRLEEE